MSQTRKQSWLDTALCRSVPWRRMAATPRISHPAHSRPSTSLLAWHSLRLWNGSLAGNDGDTNSEASDSDDCHQPFSHHLQSGEEDCQHADRFGGWLGDQLRTGRFKRFGDMRADKIVAQRPWQPWPNAATNEANP